MSSADVVVIGAGHNGLACASYLAREGLDVVVVERAPDPGGCVATEELPSGAGRLELGAFEHSGIRASGVADDLELETRFGLRWLLCDELVLSPCDDGSALALHNSLERTVDGLRRGARRRGGAALPASSRPGQRARSRSSGRPTAARRRRSASSPRSPTRRSAPRASG